MKSCRSFQGNHQNQTVVYENKICDYINYILRSENQLAKCGSNASMQLKLAIGQLIAVMIEENVRPPCVVETEDAGSSVTRISFIDVAVEMMDALDAEVIKNIFVKNYELLVVRKTRDSDFCSLFLLENIFGFEIWFRRRIFHFSSTSKLPFRTISVLTSLTS